MGTRLMSRAAVNAAIVVLGIELLSDLLPLDKWVQNVVDFFTPNKAVGQTAPQRRLSAGADQPSPIATPETDELARIMGG